MAGQHRRRVRHARVGFPILLAARLWSSSRQASAKARRHACVPPPPILSPAPQSVLCRPLLCAPSMHRPRGRHRARPRPRPARRQRAGGGAAAAGVGPAGPLPRSPGGAAAVEGDCAGGAAVGGRPGWSRPWGRVDGRAGRHLAMPAAGSVWRLRCCQPTCSPLLDPECRRLAGAGPVLDK